MQGALIDLGAILDKPLDAAIGWRRKLLYRACAGIAAWNHGVASAAGRLGTLGLYICWAEAALGLCQTLAY